MAENNNNSRNQRNWRSSDSDWSNNSGRIDQDAWNDDQNRGDRRFREGSNYDRSYNDQNYNVRSNYNDRDKSWNDLNDDEPDFNQGGYGHFSTRRPNQYGMNREFSTNDYSNGQFRNSTRGNSNIFAQNISKPSQNRTFGRSYGLYGGSSYDRGSEYDRGFNNSRNDQFYDQNYRDQNYSGRDREYGNEDRNWWDRTADEVSSWFGDEDAERRRERDRRESHRGKGPKGYSRSDERIREDINDRLSEDAFVDASDIEVTVTNGEVTLTGTVDHRMTKRRAEDLAESISGVRHVENRLRVAQYASSNETRTSIGTGTPAVSYGGAGGTETTSTSEKSKSRQSSVMNN